MPWIDISMPLFGGMPSFPGDPPFVSEPVLRIARGAPYDLSRLTLGSHAGTHLDPPSHFLPGGTSADRIDLGTLQGPCRVVEVGRRGSEIGVDELGPVPRGTSRLLLKTPNSRRWARKLEFFPDFVGLGLSAAHWLADRGVRLVGIDALSVEADPSGRFPVHRELLGRGVVILEGLLLGPVRPGGYDLACLPLRVQDGDGGPARAAVRALRARPRGRRPPR